MNALRRYSGFAPIGVFGGKCDGSTMDAAAASAIIAIALMPLGAVDISGLAATASAGVLKDTSTALLIKPCGAPG